MVKLLLLIVLLGAEGNPGSVPGDKRAPEKKDSLAPIVALDRKVEYIGRAIISSKKAMVVLRVDKIEGTYKEGDKIADTDISVFKIDSQAVVLTRKGLLFTVPFFKGMPVKGEESKEEFSELSSIKCPNIRAGKKFIAQCFKAITLHMEDDPRGVLITEVPRGNLFGEYFHKGDILLSVNRQSTENRQKLFQVMRKVKESEGSKIPVEILTQGKKRTVVFNFL